jgi:hypothetical protein
VIELTFLDIAVGVLGGVVLNWLAGRLVRRVLKRGL